MGSELDLDDAIASILADSDEDNTLSKKKITSSSKRKTDHKKSAKSVKSKALTSSVSDEDFYKNLSKLSEEPNNDETMDEVVVTEEDAKKMASDLAGLDDLDSDLLGTLGKKTKVSSPRNKQAKDQDFDKHNEPKRKTSTGSLHRKGSVTPFRDQGDGDALGGHVFSDDDSEDALNSSMNSTRSRQRKTGSKKTPNRISPSVSLDDMEAESKTNSRDQSKGSKSKGINFDSDSDLPGLNTNEASPTSKATKKSSTKSRRKKKEKPEVDLFGDDDDLPDLDGKPAGKTQRSDTPPKRASSALDNLMGNKTKNTSQDSKKKTPTSLDEFMANVSTNSKSAPKSETQSPVKSPTTEETFQFGGYMPSAAAGSGRRSRNNRPETASEFGRRSVTFSDDLGIDEDMFGMEKRPSTAPAGRKKRDERGTNDPLSSTFSSSSSRYAQKDNGDWLGLEGRGGRNPGTSSRERKVDDLSPQTSLEGSKSSTSGDWLGLGDDLTDSQLNASHASTPEVKREESPERVSPTSSPRQKLSERKQDEELSKMLDLVPDINNNTSKNEDKSLFPWEGGKSSGRRRRANAPVSSKQESKTEIQEPIDSGHTTKTRQDQSLFGDAGGKSGAQSEDAIGNISAFPNETSSSNHNTSATVSNKSDDTQSRIGPVRATPPGVGTPQMAPPTGYQTAPGMAQQGSSETLGTVEVGRGQVSSIVQNDIGMAKQRNEIDLRGIRDTMQEIEKQKYKMELELSNKVAELETKIRRLEADNESLTQSLELTKQRHKDEISSLESSHRVRVQTVEESYQRREAREKEETELLISKHKETVRQMETEKSDLQAAHARKISAIESSKLNEIERLNDLHRRALEELRDEHTLEMNHLKKMKEQEVSATVTAYSHTKSLQGLMEQVLNSTKQVGDLHHLVEVSHKTNQQERDITAKAKDEYLNQLHDRLLKQQAENEEERTRLQNLVAKMEVHVREQNRRLEEDKWKLSQEDSRLKSLRASLEEERRMTREQLEAERNLLQRTKKEFLSQQRRMMVEINEERRTLTLERSELSAAQRGMLNTEKQKQNTFTKMDVEQEATRTRLEEDIAALKVNETQLKKEQEELRREKQEFKEKQEKWDKEKDRIGKLGLELERRSQEIDEISLEAARVREEGTKSLETAQRMQLEIAKQANELELKVLHLQEKERQIAAERLATVKERREFELEKRRGFCTRCSQSQLTQVIDSSGKRETPLRTLLPSESTQLSAHRSTGEVISTPAPTTSVLALTPDLLINTLDLNRTLRRWSQDKEQDEEFLAKESEFLSSLNNSRLNGRSASSSPFSEVF